jgi:hypothetical protein
MTDHGHDEESRASTGSGSASKGGLSRRQVMTASAVAAGVGLASIPARAGAAAGGQAVSLGVSGTTTVEFRGRVTQSGDSFISYGYLIRASNAGDDALFADLTTRSDTTALLTAYATGHLLARVTDMSVHSLDIVGTMTVYQRSQPGASFGDPSSFQAGTAVASYDMTLQDVLTVFAPAQGLPTLTGDMLQTDAATLSGPLAGQKFGRQGARLRFFATGLGALTDPKPPNSQLEIAGNWSIE